MTKESYEKSMTWIADHIGVKPVRLAVKLLTAVTAVFYIGAVCRMAMRKDLRLIRLIALPAAGFLGVTLFRKKMSAKRPYEIYGFTPLLEKDTKGNSFPSRHVFSNMIIAMAVLSVNTGAGIFLMVCGVCLAVLRVMTGVHFPKDVIAGAGIAILLGLFF